MSPHRYSSLIFFALTNDEHVRDLFQFGIPDLPAGLFTSVVDRAANPLLLKQM